MSPLRASMDFWRVFQPLFPLETQMFYIQVQFPTHFKSDKSFSTFSRKQNFLQKRLRSISKREQRHIVQPDC